MSVKGLNSTTMTASQFNPTAVVIGAGDMVVQCATMLEKRGFDLLGLHGSDLALREWAAQNQSRQSAYCETFEAFDALAQSVSFDLLFSIVNFRILSERLVKAPRKFAINYHNAPLPRYAGSHAAEWALHNRERKHGITWHVMESHVDTGEILKQKLFSISQTETLQSPHRKCFVYAVRGFGELLDELKTDTVVRTPQDLSKRTFHRASDKPSPCPAWR
jgi:methionyl-tRNA formyltransferase